MSRACRIPVACTDRNQVSIYCSYRMAAANQTLSTNHSKQSTHAPRNLLSLLRFSLSFGFMHCFHLCILDPKTATSQGSSEKQVQDKLFSLWLQVLVPVCVFLSVLASLRIAGHKVSCCTSNLLLRRDAKSDLKPENLLAFLLFTQPKQETNT